MAIKKREVNHSLPIHYSQNYIVNAGLIERLLEQSDIHADDEVLDIGAGKGIITQALLNLGCNVTAIELDERNMMYLKKRFGGEKRCTLLSGDFLTMPLPKRNYKIFSNIPFFITSDILNKITQAKNPPTAAYLVMQKQAAMKYCGTPETTLKSLLLKPRFHMTIVHHFSQGDFSPRPGVEIVLLRICRRNTNELTAGEYALYHDFICYCFQNNQTFSERIFSYRQLKELRKRHGISNFQASALKYEEWILLFKCFSQHTDAIKKSQVTGAYRKYLLQETRLKKQYRGRK